MKKQIKTKSFSRLSRAEQRVKIAEDVIAQIKIKTFNPIKGSYVSIDNYWELEDNYQEKSQLNLAIQNKKVQCSCCALGSIMLSHVNKVNHCTIEHAHYSINDNYIIKERLSRVFSSGQLDLIEAAFEGKIISDDQNILRKYDDFHNFLDYTPLAKKALKFHEKYLISKNRLVGIMNNLIKNKGTFLP